MSGPTAHGRFLAPTIVGRDAVFERLDWAFSAATQSECVVQLAGDAGLGKTRLASILEGSPDPRLVQAVATTSRGNPFAVEELARHEVAAGRLDPVTGVWSVGAPFGPAVDGHGARAGRRAPASRVGSGDLALGGGHRAPEFQAEASSGHRALGRRVDAARARAAAAGARWNSGARDGVLEELTAARGELYDNDPAGAHLEVLPVLAWALWMCGDLTSMRRSGNGIPSLRPRLVARIGG